VKAGYDVSFGADAIAASAKQRWIVTLSLLVCIVGIINAQLMSVTERFREIGTMKCLGALDRFIVRLFVLEALMQGLAGSCAGAILGVVSATVSSTFTLGTSIFSSFPWVALCYSMLLSVIVGTSLSLIGVIYPAILAARMQPVEAMRLEQ
ncbi:MAG: FtsX-like permease family protein, partial [Desulfofustis sp.]|nr:FtsX-like permease family protein [Desulfofustis sp.]